MLALAPIGPGHAATAAIDCPPAEVTRSAPLRRAVHRPQRPAPPRIQAEEAAPQRRVVRRAPRPRPAVVALASQTDTRLGCIPRSSPRAWQVPPVEPSGLVGMTRFTPPAALGGEMAALASTPLGGLGGTTLPATGGPLLTGAPAPPLPPAAPPQPAPSPQPEPFPPPGPGPTDDPLPDPGPGPDPSVVPVPVPEPGSIILLVTGIAGLAAARRRR